ncbi:MULTISPECIES: hypothetical protein [Lysinibacillus]|uniref:hypothetical protein n=1 Tax=Lysinibacillus TaxID=400634 RepID=UPI00214AF793|nr:MULTISPECIES: hypothetical protein [Lysinibacillus]UUV23266.1 hypothetical protein NP781_15425 [Lysinibacillus sp. FN11]UYB46131.1 hypothetical protein OCI51_18040 [Lysinibacillus capsici]WHP41832.1 hypothetical protein QIX46_02120 [Lysinibacillus boronitolerans]
MSKYKVSISFKQNSIHLYEFIKTKENISSYLCKLIEADMNGEHSSLDLESQVEQIMHKLLQNQEFLQPITINSNKSKDNLSAEDIDLINNLF